MSTRSRARGAAAPIKKPYSHVFRLGAPNRPANVTADRGSIERQNRAGDLPGQDLEKYEASEHLAEG